MNFLKNAVKKYTDTSLILRIVIGLVIGAILGMTLKSWTWVGILGTLFVGALRAIAPILVFVLIISALSTGQSKLDRKFGLVLFFYMFSTFLAAAAGVTASFLFPVTLKLGEAAQSDTVPQNVGEVLQNLLVRMVENPVSAIMGGNYIGILFWAVVLGIAFKKIAASETRIMLKDASEAVAMAVRGVINFAPFGICGLVFSTVSEYGLSVFKDYGRLTAVPERERYHRILHPKQRGQYPGEHGTLREARPGSGHVFRIYSAGCYDQHGWCSDHYHSHGSGSRQYSGRPCGYPLSSVSEHSFHTGSLRRFRRRRRISSADPYGMLAVWYLQ